MSDHVTNLDDFFADGVGDALSEGASRALPEGTYRWKVTSVEPMQDQRNGVYQKELVIRGVNADTAEGITRSWRFTLKDGTPNKIAMTMLAEQLIRAGIRKSVRALAEDCTDMPVINLIISSRVQGDKVYTEQTIAACADQTLGSAPAKKVEEGLNAVPF
jgi:hypothetical protein